MTITERADAAESASAPAPPGTRNAVMWTLVSRATGFARLAVSAAVLGPTFLGNVFLTVNTIPNLAYGLLGGALMAGVVVPALVEHLDGGRRERAGEVAGRFLAAVVTAAAALSVLMLAASWLAARVLTVGVPARLASGAQRTAWLLLVLVVPQVVGYAVAGVAAAVQNAHGRYGLAAGGFIVENVGVTLGLAVVGWRAGTAREVHQVGSGLLVALGLVGTLPVLAHAAVQCWGAARLGMRLRVRPYLRDCWRDDDVRRLVRQAVPSMVVAGLLSLQLLAGAVVAGSVAGGWVALQIALAFAILPSGLIGRPLGTTLLRPVAQRFGEGDRAAAVRAYRAAGALGLGVALPATAGLVVLAGPLAALTGVGAMGAAVALVSWSLIGLAPGVVGDTLFEISKSLPLAARRAHGIVAPAVVRTGLTVAALPAAFAFGGLARLAVVGLALSAGDLGGAWHLHVRALDLGGVEEPGRWRRPRLAGLGVGRAVVAALAFAAAAFAGRRLVESFAIGGRALRSVASLTIGGLLGAVACAAYYWWVGSPVLPGWTGRTRGRRDRSARTAAIPAIGAVAIVAGVAIAAALARVGPALVVAGALTIVLLAVTARRPASAAWIYLGAMPLLAGIDRGRFVPLLRPTEVLQIVVTAGVVVGALGRRRGRPWPALRITRLDTALGALVLAGSVAPLARLLLAGTRPTGADLLACVPLWKYAALYVLFRATIRSRADVRRACAVSLAAAVAVSVIAVLQTLDLAGVPRLLATFWAPRGDAGDLTEGRGTATFAGAIATSVYLTFNLALALALALRSRGRVRWFNSIAGAALLCGVIGTAQFSGLAGVAIVVAVVSVSSGRVRQLAKGALVAAPVAALIAAPALVARFGELGTNGLPVSWAVRLYNLQTYYWPQLAGRGWLLGTRPNTIVAAPERWRDVIYVESGHTWLLLVGGVPLLVAFVAFTVIAARSLREAARLDDDAWSPMARAALAAVTAVFVLMVLDTHLTMRGSADMLFALTGMALGRYGSRALPWPLPRWHGGNARHLAVTP